MKRVRIALGVVLTAQVLFAVLLFGKQPLLFRAVAHGLSAFPPSQEGMRLLRYRNPTRSGKASIRYSPGSLGQLDAANASLEAYAIWRVGEAGTYTLLLHCDDLCELFVDGHRVVGVVRRSANVVGRSELPLAAGPHFVVVHLVGGPVPGWFSLEVQAPGQPTPALLAGRDLFPVQQRAITLGWRLVSGALGWIATGAFWASLLLLLVVVLACAGAETARQAAVNGALIVGGTLVAVLLGETLVRFVVTPPMRVTLRQIANQPPRPERDVFMIQTEHGFRHSPNSEVLIDHPTSPGVPVLYRTNSLGYRNRELGPKSGPRILFLGDSVTLGLGVNEEYTFTRLVERLARQRNADWETINAGVNGLGTNGELAVLNETGLSVAPDVVVLCFYLNDFLESPGIYLTRLPGILDRSWLAHQLVNLFAARHFLASSERESRDSPPMLKPPDEIYAWQDEFRRHSTVLTGSGPVDPDAAALNAAVLKAFADWGGAFSPHTWGPVEILLEEFARLGRQHHFRFAIAAFPVRQQVEAGPLLDYPQERLRGIAERLQAPYLDLLPVLRANHAPRSARDQPVFLDHCHLTPHGHAIVADALASFLAGIIPAPAGR
jgi:lysophospholipase L1-like esterase